MSQPRRTGTDLAERKVLADIAECGRHASSSVRAWQAAPFGLLPSLGNGESETRLRLASPTSSVATSM